MDGEGDMNSPAGLYRTFFIGCFLHPWGEKSDLLNAAEMLVGRPDEGSFHLVQDGKRVLLTSSP